MTDPPRFQAPHSLFVNPPSIGQMRDPLATDWNAMLPAHASDLVGLIDFARMNQVFEDFLEVVGLPVAILDLDAHVLASSRWQRLCMEFHRVHPETCARCIESDTSLATAMQQGREYALYRCRNGLTDCAAPIVIEGRHIANLFIGQFLLAPPDLEYFRQQAAEFGFDEEAYFQALAEVPVIAEDKLPSIMRFLTGFAHLAANMSLERKRNQAMQSELERWVEERTRELSESRRQIQAIYDASNAAIFLLNLDGAITHANHCMAEMFGCPMEELIGASYLDCVHPAERGQAQRNLHALVAGAIASVDAERRYLRRDGGLFWGHFTGRCMAGADGRLAGMVGVVADITERKQAEAELERYRLHLEELVQLRTAQLEQAKESAEAANRMKSVFLANMSHELRTPLNAILGFAQIMERDDRIPEDERRNLDTINRSGRHLLALINDVLEISRIEAGRASVHNETFDPDDLLHSIEEMIRIRAEARGLAFAVERHGVAPPHVCGDAHHIRQVLINLLGNAIKYTERGQVVLHVFPTDGYIRFEVADTGPGIAAEELPRIFQAFYQTAEGAAKGEGTGLGLTISREFVRLMGGELTVASEPGRGSVFAFTLPLAEAKSPPAVSRPGRVVGLEAGQAVVRILVAEDDGDSRELIVRLLESVGLEVWAVENGRKAVESWADLRPDLILMDMRMPEMDGYEATRRIRTLPGGDGVKIVALTASAFHENRTIILDAGCDDMVSKPLDAERLFRVMGELLDLRFRHALDIAPPPPLPAENAGLGALPEALQAELKSAAELLDLDAVGAIAERIAAEYPREARAIAELARGFRFDELAGLCTHGDGASP